MMMGVAPVPPATTVAQQPTLQSSSSSRFSASKLQTYQNFQSDLVTLLNDSCFSSDSSRLRLTETVESGREPSDRAVPHSTDRRSRRRRRPGGNDQPRDRDGEHHLLIRHSRADDGGNNNSFAYSTEEEEEEEQRGLGGQLGHDDDDEGVGFIQDDHAAAINNNPSTRGRRRNLGQQQSSGGALVGASGVFGAYTTCLKTIACCSGVGERGGEPHVRGSRNGAARGATQLRGDDSDEDEYDDDDDDDHDDDDDELIVQQCE